VPTQNCIGVTSVAFSKNLIFRAQILDRVLLLTINPAGEDQQQKGQGTASLAF
jgi:hypothetical protein